MHGWLDQHGKPPCMRLIGVWVVALLCVFAQRSVGAASLAVYGALPAVENVALSPDGSRFAYVRTEGDTRIVVVVSAVDLKLIRYVRFGEEKLRDLQWADNDTVLITASRTASLYGFGVEAFLVSAFNIAKNEMRSLPGKVPGPYPHFANLVVGQVMVRHVDGHTVVFVPALEATEGIALIRCDLTSGLNRIARGSTPDTIWLVDAQGRLAGQQNYDQQSQHWSIKVLRDGVLHDGASGRAALDEPRMLGFGPNSDSLLVSVIGAGSKSWKLLSIATGSFVDGPLQEAFYSPILEPYTGRLIGGNYLGDTVEPRFFDPAIEERWQNILKEFDGAQVSYVSASSDFSKFAVLVQGAQVGYQYVLVDVSKPAVVSIGKVYANLEKPLEVQKNSYAASDGLQISAFLTLPRGRDAHRLPLIVLPHGGPEAHDTLSFHWWAQALADQGYAVLQPNFRGSDVTQRLREAGYGQWGRKMQTDLSDGVGYLGNEGIVDPDKVCIVGADYGGYAALAGVTLGPSIYRCAVSVAGLADLSRMLHWEGGGGLDSRYLSRYLERLWGVSGSSDSMLEGLSPVKQLNAVNVPVLLIHGRDDTVVPYEQSQIMFEAMKRAKKEVELVTLKKEDHWLSHGATRLQMLETSVAFLRKYNPPD